MTVSLKHAFTSAKADGGDADLVQPSDWNAEHEISIANARLLGNTTGSAGIQEISVGSGLTLSAGVLSQSAITSVALDNSGLQVKDTNASHSLTIAPGSDLTANRTLTLTTGNADRTLNISAGNVTISAAGAALIDDANAGAQRTTLGLGSMAVETASNYLAKSGNLSGLANTATARSNLGLGSAATASTGTSGGAVPLLNGANTHSGSLTLTGNFGSSMSMNPSANTTQGFRWTGVSIYLARDNIVAEIQRSGSDGTVLRWWRDTTNVGSISITGSATAYNTSSDYRLKENVVELTGALERLALLRPVRCNFIGDARTVDAFIAHEVQDIVPGAVHGAKDAVDENGNPEYQGIDHSKLVPLLTACCQELMAEIAGLKAGIAALKTD